jgi:DNA-binding NtrC family response regulator
MQVIFSSTLAVTMQASNPIQVLVVEDDAEFRGCVVRCLAQAGYQTQEAGTGEQALELLRQQQFDVIVLDMILPGVTGLALLQRFREMRVTSEVVMLTGQASVETAVEAMKLGAFDYLRKPASLRELERIVWKAAEKHRQRHGPTHLETASPAVLECDDLSTIERLKVVEVLRRERGNKARSARVLGIDRRKLYRLLEKYQIAEREYSPLSEAITKSM